jgi:hypothetical protein
VSRLTRLTAVAIGALLVATAAQAQTIAGTVRDTSGAVMPGVTVEAASPALIERMRTVVTDGSGQYKIVSLTPGVYTVTFTLPGFTTVKREGIELTGDFTASVNAVASGATATKSIQLIEPGTLWGGYLNQLDLRLSKGVKVGRYSFRADANLYNVFNSDFVNSVNTTFSTTAANQFMRPTNVLQGRLFKIGGQFQF